MAEHVAPVDGGDGSDLYFVEPATLLTRNVSVGVRLLAGAVIAFFGSFLFAYIYLRERDSGAQWRPTTVHVPLGTGVAVMACILAAAAMTRVATLLLPRLGEARWREAILLVQLLALAALGVQCYQWATLPFGPNSGAYASVFVCWTGFYGGLALTSLIYWTQTALSGSFRHRRVDPGPTVAVAGMAGPGGALRGRLAGESSSLAFFWSLMATIELVTFMLLYVAR